MKFLSLVLSVKNKIFDFRYMTEYLYYTFKRHIY